jgi:hypothetical protein
MAEDTKTQETAKAPDFTRHEEFTSLYANDIQFEGSQFDLKLIFGELDQLSGKTWIKQHTAMTIPWIQAKLALYYLQIQVAAFEFQNGKIKIPGDLLPEEMAELTEEQKQVPRAEELWKAIKILRDQFVSNL